MKPIAKRVAMLGAAALLVPAGTVLLISGSAYAAGPTATFTKTSDWSSGFTGQYTIANSGASAIAGWTVQFDLPAGTTVGTYWDVLITQSGNHYTAKNREYNATVAPGATATFGFVGAGGGSPANCTLNGAPCAGGGNPDPGDTQPPTAPRNLRSTGRSVSTVSLAWDASTDNKGVTGYEVLRGGSSAASVTGTTATITGLVPTTAYTFTVRAKDAAGNVSTVSNTVTVTTDEGAPQPPPPPGSIRVSPYIDITMNRPSLAEVARATGQKTFTLAFALGSTAGCEPAWGGTIPLNDARIINDVKALRALGGDVIVATGGAAGPYLESLCGSVSALAGAYKKILDTVGTRHLDIDIEASVPTDTMNKALAQVQRERPGTTVSYTLMVQGDDYGLTPQLGVDVLKNAKANGVTVTIVNPMTMEFGSSRSNWGDAVVAAAQSTLRQMKTEVWPEKGDAELKRMLGVTPMIGRNFNGRVFDQSHARQLVSWAGSNHIGELAFWSVGRDNGGCPGGGVSPTCSSISQSLYEFTSIFKGFNG
jgi:chitinase